MLWFGRLEDIEKSINDICERLEQVASRPIPQDVLPLVTAIQGNLGTLMEEIGRLREKNTGVLELQAEVTNLHEVLRKQNAAIAEGIERTARTERRINSTVQRARGELKKQGLEHTGLEEEAAQLQLVDAVGSALPGLHPVLSDLEEPELQAPDKKTRALNAKWGTA